MFKIQHYHIAPFLLDIKDFTKSYNIKWNTIRMYSWAGSSYDVRTWKTYVTLILESKKSSSSIILKLTYNCSIKDEKWEQVEDRIEEGIKKIIPTVTIKQGEYID